MSTPDAAEEQHTAEQTGDRLADSPQESDSAAVALERTYVHHVYDRIAEHFSATRYAPWPPVQAFIERLPVGALLLDVGAGNGKYAGCSVAAGHYYVGTDRCTPLLQLAQCRWGASTDAASSSRCPGGWSAEWVIADALQQPFRDGLVDAAMSIAVLHHFHTAQRRLHGVIELLRQVRAGGCGLVYVWTEAGLPARLRQRAQRTADGWLLPWHHRQESAGMAPCSGAAPGRRYQRFYHLFAAGELRALVETAARALESSSPTPTTTVHVVRAGPDRENDMVEFRMAPLAAPGRETPHHCPPPHGLHRAK
ncbi:hypothetical protein CDCA_CDCA20G4791 [Cyanidium caldarium]|uniref:Methyltransferase type 11 domain-containing protein n=1 Tax=Cyanidium caldarium TaxID=2771 RepID=A0AAV9J398_CYACA|nr:hypothetical protein CDCA_CDCA20G4791 [Cyanidium caldarium]